MQALLLMMLEHQLEPNLKSTLIKVQCTCKLVPVQNIAERQGWLSILEIIVPDIYNS